MRQADVGSVSFITPEPLQVSDPKSVVVRAVKSSEIAEVVQSDWTGTYHLSSEPLSGHGHQVLRYVPYKTETFQLQADNLRFLSGLNVEVSAKQGKSGMRE